MRRLRLAHFLLRKEGMFVVKCFLIGDDRTCLDTDATIQIEYHIEKLINQHQSIAFYYSPNGFFGVFCKLTISSMLKLYCNNTILKFEEEITSKIIEGANYCITCVSKETYHADLLNQINKRKAQGLLEEYDTAHSSVRREIEPDWETYFFYRT